MVSRLIYIYCICIQASRPHPRARFHVLWKYSTWAWSQGSYLCTYQLLDHALVQCSPQLVHYSGAEQAARVISPLQGGRAAWCPSSRRRRTQVCSQRPELQPAQPPTHQYTTGLISVCHVHTCVHTSFYTSYAVSIINTVGLVLFSFNCD